MESVEEIKNSVFAIQTATSELILSSETWIRKVNQSALLIAEIGDSLQQMMSMLANTASSAQEISSSMTLQQNNHELLADGLKNVSENFELSITTCQQVNDIAEELRALSEELTEITEGLVIDS